MKIDVEVCYALADKQWLVAVKMPSGSTVEDAIAASGIDQHLGANTLSEMTTGVWGRPVAREHIVRDGDRVELYRPLIIDPREARRQRAALGETMRKSDAG